MTKTSGAVTFTTSGFISIFDGNTYTSTSLGLTVQSGLTLTSYNPSTVTEFGTKCHHGPFNLNTVTQTNPSRTFVAARSINYIFPIVPFSATFVCGGATTPIFTYQGFDISNNMVVWETSVPFGVKALNGNLLINSISTSAGITK